MEIFSKLPFDLQNQILMIRPSHPNAILIRKHFNSILFRRLKKEQIDMYIKADDNNDDFEILLKTNPFNLWYFSGRSSIFNLATDEFYLCDDDYIKQQIEEYKTMSSRDYLAINRNGACRVLATSYNPEFLV